MHLTTVQHLYHEFRICDDSFDSEVDFANLDLGLGSSSTMDDKRVFSNASNLSDITCGDLPSNTCYTKLLNINDERSFSSISNFSQGAFEDLDLSDTSVTALMDELHDSWLESSDSLSDDLMRSMAVSHAAFRHRASKLHSIPTEVS
jgi:hypothetical protein